MWIGRFATACDRRNFLPSIGNLRLLVHDRALSAFVVKERKSVSEKLPLLSLSAVHARITATIIKAVRMRGRPARRSRTAQPFCSRRHRTPIARRPKSIGGSKQMRVKLKGLPRVRQGSRTAHAKIVVCVEGKGAPHLRGEPASPEFIASYNEAVATKIAAPAPDFQSE